MPHSLHGRLLALFVVVILISAAVVWTRRPDRNGKNPGIGGGDFAGCMIVGNLALDGRDIYRDSPPGVNTWPPLFSLFCTIPALLARPTPYLARGLWIVLNYFLVGLVLQMTVRLVYGQTISLSGNGIAPSLVDAAIVVPVLLCARFIISNFDHLQANVLIFALVLGALVLHCTNRDLLSGCCLGLAFALKIMPALFVPYFIFRGRYRVALAATVVGVVLFVSPCLSYGWDRYMDYIFSWLNALKAGWSVGKMNQSAFAMLDRFLGHGIALWQSGPTNGLFRSGSLLPTLAWLLLVGIVTTAAVMLFRDDEKRDSPASLLEYSVVFIVSDLFGPVAWKAYFINLLLPCTLLYALMRSAVIGRSERRVVFVVMALYALLAAAPLADVGRVGRTMEMLSAPTIGILAILFLLLWLRPRVAACGPLTAGENVRWRPT